MDFVISEDQLAFAGLAARILADGASHEKLREIENKPGPRFDRALWAELSRAGLLGIAIPEVYGGSEQGFFELALILEEAGRRTAAVPLLETTVLGALPIAQFGSEEQKASWLPRVVEGEVVLTAALIEDRGDPERPATRAEKRDGGYRLNGRKTCVPAGSIADRILLAATLEEDGIGLFLLDPQAEGVKLQPLRTTSGQPEASLELVDVSIAEGDRLGASQSGSEMLAWLRERATAALCVMALGVCEEALRLTADYTKERKQFTQPIATFQAVGQRQADAYVDTEAIRLTSWQACWRIGAGLPAAETVAVAKYWAAAAGQRVVHTAAHLHGGMGVDRDYPLHRYFLYAKQLELSLGGSSFQLRTLGKMLADGTA
jgi:alkylation response protein AidB-like acyl-CoA dehydrogenase